MKTREILKELTIDDLPKGYRYVAEVCGMDVARTLMENLGGVEIYVPKPNSSFAIEKYIIKRLNDIEPENEPVHVLVAETGTSKFTIQKLLQRLAEEGKIARCYRSSSKRKQSQDNQDTMF